MKAFGSILLAGGFLAGSYFAVSRVESIDWLQYGVCAAVMIAGMIVLRIDRAAAAAAGSEHHDASIDVLQRSLASLLGKVDGLAADASDVAQLAIHRRIDAELMDDIDSFVDAREAMIPRLGMQSYADIMSPFANAERLLNRAWSASADGYVDEVRDCIATARAELGRAQELLAAARGAASPA